MRTSSLRLSIFLLCAACSKTPEKPPALPVAPAAPTKPASAVAAGKTAVQVEAELIEQLMRAAFPKRQLTSELEYIVMLPDPDNRKQLARFMVHMENRTTLADGKTILVINAAAVDENGTPQVAHITPALLSLIVLQQKAGKWQVLSRHENIAELGSSGEMGELHWVAPGKGKSALAIEHGGTWSGSTITLLSLYEVTNGRVRAMTAEPIPIHSDDEGGCGPGGDCWNTDGDWRFEAGKDGAQYDDLVIDFKSSKWTGEEIEPGTAKDKPADSAPATPHVETSEQARYRFDGKELKLVEGKNPTPPV